MYFSSLKGSFTNEERRFQPQKHKQKYVSLQTNRVLQARSVLSLQKLSYKTKVFNVKALLSVKYCEYLFRNVCDVDEN